MNDVLVALISATGGVLIALIGIYTAKQSSKAKKREDMLQETRTREESIWKRIEADQAKQASRIETLEGRVERAEKRADAAEDRAIRAERERDRKDDEIRDLNEVIEAFIQDRIDLDAWVIDGGTPPVPGASWRVVQLIEKRNNPMEEDRE